jgi:type I restriction enzyme S subunit
MKGRVQSYAEQRNNNVLAFTALSANIRGQVMTAKSTVRDYVSLQRGTTYKGNLVGKPGPALLGLGSIYPGGGFRGADYKTYGGDCPEKLMLYPGDLFVSLKGATKDGEMIGSVARVPTTVESGRLTQDTVKLVFHKPDTDVAAFLYWLLRTPQYRGYCAGRATGSAVVALSREDFLSYPVPPLTPARSGIVRLLEKLDRKIELNQKSNETLEAMARALFKSWFVDFDPVRAKAEGRSTGLPAHIAALFPESFEDSELGEIPSGWAVKSLDEIGHFLNGLALQKYPPSGGRSLPVIKIAQLRAGKTGGADRASADLKPDYVVHDGDVLFSWSGSLECVLWAGGQGALNQHLFKVTSDKFPKWFYYLGIHQHLDQFRQIAAGKATTMGHIQRHHLTAAKVVVPPAPLLRVMSRHFAPLVDQIVQLKRESKALASVRDLLLPKLISGELRITKAEHMVEANV